MAEASTDLVQDLASSRASHDALVRRSLSDLEAQFNAMRDLIDASDAQLEERIGQEAQAAAADYERSRMLMVGASVSALLLGLLGALWTIVLLSRGLRQVQAALQRLASDDLTEVAEVRGSDEVADLLRSLDGMILTLREVVTRAAASSRHVAAGSSEMAATAEQLSQGATEQASATEEASASVEQMAANIRQTAQNATDTAGSARRSAEEARLSGEAVNDAVGAVRTIPERITVVQEIARQTDLLALNAAPSDEDRVPTGRHP